MSQNCIWSRQVGTINGYNSTMISQHTKNGEKIKTDIYIDFNKDGIPDMKVFQKGNTTSVFNAYAKDGKSSWVYNETETQNVQSKEFIFTPNIVTKENSTNNRAQTPVTPKQNNVTTPPLTQSQEPQQEEQVPPQKQEAPKTSNYKVKSGDSFDKIAKKIREELIKKNGSCSLSVIQISQQLQKANPKVSAKNLQIGTDLVVPDFSGKATTTENVATTSTTPKTETNTAKPINNQSEQSTQTRKKTVLREASTHKIKSGENFHTIGKKIAKELAKKSGVVRLDATAIANQIAAANPSVNPASLKIGKEIKIPQLVYTQKLLPVDEKDKKFKSSVDFIFSVEGDYSNHKADKGGATKYGITQEVYNQYLRDKKADTGNKKLETKKDVKNITKAEAEEIYFNNYYNKSGASQVTDKKIALLLFDTAVNCGVEKAREMYKKAGNNVEKFLALRQEHYDNIIKNDASQKKFQKGWNNRLAKLRKELNSYT